MDMKELYTSPEVKLINFQAQENLTAEVEFSDSTTEVKSEDIALDLFL